MNKLRREEYTRQQYPLEDAALKTAAQYFGEEFLPYLGIEEKVRYIAPTESVHLDVRKMYQDFNYAMEDGTWLHLEFESDSIKTEDLRRFREYEATTSRTHKVEVMTCVICTSTVKELKTELRSGMNKYRVRVVRLKDDNADAVIKDLLKKQKEGVGLTRDDMVRAVLTPLMSGELPKKERILDISRLLRREEENLAVSKEEMQKLQAVLYALATKFLTKLELDEVKEVLEMTVLGEMLVECGRVEMLISMICKKLRKDQSISQITEALETDIYDIEGICKIAEKYAPDYDEEKIYKEVMKRRE